MTQDFTAILGVHIVADGETKEQALEKAVKDKSYEVVSYIVDGEQAQEYTTLAEYAREHNADISQLWRKAKAGKFPGAMLMGKTWVVPRGTKLVDRRVKSGRYVGSEYFREYRQRRKTPPKDDREE